MFNYESPIEVIYNRLQEQITMDFENNCIKAVQQYGFNVNKEELKKALQYDRGQYEKGYNDAIKSLRALGRWEHNCECTFDVPEPFQYKCSICGCPSRSTGHRFCSNCGASMWHPDYSEGET